MASAATLTGWIRDPLAEWSYEIAVFAIAAAVCFRRRALHADAAGLAMAAVAVWGFLQLALGATVYRYATVNATLRFAAFAATTFLAPPARSHAVFLRAFAWFAFAIGVLSVVAYYTSPGNVLWTIPNQGRDAWGPFLNRNHFAAFLELALPVALWLAITRDRSYAFLAAAMLAAGIACASRAGAALLVAESVAVFVIQPGARKAAARFGVAATVLIAVAGAGHLRSRMFEPDPLRYRREMAHSTAAMFFARPWTGFGLGTFSTVYPQFASFDAGALVDHAHNDWLEWASEGGVGFAAAWGVLAIVMLKRARRAIWLIGVPAVMIHALVDYPFARIGISAWTFLLIGMREPDRDPH